MKRKLVLLVVTLVVALLAGAAMPASAQEPFKGKTLKLAAGLPEGSLFGKHFKWWAEELDKRTGGKVKVNIFWIESLVKTKDMLPAIQSGFVDVGWIIGIYFPNNLRLYGLLDHI